MGVCLGGNADPWALWPSHLDVSLGNDQDVTMRRLLWRVLRQPYKALQPWARVAKALLQMVVGVAVVVSLAVALLNPGFRGLSADLILGRVAIGLAFATGIELSYTLFTDGPDEVLQPAMMGVSAAIIFLVSKVSTASWTQALALLLLGLLLGLLFLVRKHYADNIPEEWPSQTRADGRAAGK
jgi:hypothetical protein